MTRSEYLEFVQESLATQVTHGALHLEPGMILYDYPKIVDELHTLHHQYCLLVEHVLFPERTSPDIWSAMRWKLTKLRFRFHEWLRWPSYPET